MKVSIIIPVYKVEPYIERCIESVLRQTYRELEVIIVDDCTPDRSIEIARNLINKSNCKDLDFKFIKHDKNRGVSVARNTGIMAATGDYLFIIDSDDWITDNCISLMVQPLKNRLYDFVTAECETRGNDMILPRQNMGGEMTGTEKIAKAYSLHYWHCFPWNKLCNRSFILENELYFKEGLNHEDQLWCAQLACSAESLYFVNETTYFYYIHEKSFMATEPTLQIPSNYMEVLKSFYEYLEKKKSFSRDIEGVIEERMKGTLWSVLPILKPSRYFVYKTFRKCDVRSWRTKNTAYSTIKDIIKHFDVYMPIPLGFIFKEIGIKSIAFKERLCNSRLLILFDYIKAKYYRRWSQYTRTGKIALCCIAKLENDYIRYFVEYYKNLHFDKIYLYDNNNPDSERFEEVIGDYIHDGFVEIIDFRGEKVAQLRAYQDCYDKHNKEYDWIAFFDIDEFLTFEDKSTNIHSFLQQKKYRPFQIMHINWKTYGDNDLLDNDGRDIVDRLKNPITPYDFKSLNSTIPENNHIKSIVRGGLSALTWNKNPHTPTSVYYQSCNPSGFSVETSSPFQRYDFSIAYIRHYSTKTIGEWVRGKMRRGLPDRAEDAWNEVLNLDFFFRYNIKTKEKVEYAKRLLEEYDD